VRRPRAPAPGAVNRHTRHTRRTGDAPFLEWAVAGRPRRGEEVSGDQATVQVLGSRGVVAVVDGLGHGPEAAAAAKLAIDAVERHGTEPLDEMMRLIHENLSASRGAAATVAIVDGKAGRMEWVGVGNVNGLLVRAADATRRRTSGAFLCRGVLGYGLPPLHLSGPVELSDGDSIVIATDGVRGDLTTMVGPDVPVARAADSILTRCTTDEDDALVFVARYRTGPAE
jgi:negative regulator of sigma-B (phosphoserine phosphatase)